MFTMLTLLGIPIIFMGYIIINKIIYELNEKLIAKDLFIIQQDINSAYTRSINATSPENVVSVQQVQQEILDRYKYFRVGDTGYFYILNSNGTVVFHPDLPVGSQFDTPYIKQLIADKQGVLHYRNKDKPYYGVFQTFAEWDWIIVITITEAELFEDRAIYLNFVVITSFLIFAGVLLLSYLSTRGTTKKIQAILQYLKTIERGDLNTPAPKVSHDEIGMILQGILSMVTKLTATNQQLINEIQHRYTTETALLEAKEAAEKARLAAESANRAKSSFLANMSHELRTPLNGILGYTQILQRDKNLTEPQIEGIHIIHSSGEYLLTLINDILDLSKIEANQLDLYPIDFNLHEFLYELVNLFQIRAKEKGISFLYEPVTTLSLGVHGDAIRLRQILINLLSNAIKFTERGGVTFKVGEYEDKVRFQIEDTGIGIHPHDIENIFIPFQQLGEVTRKVAGTGLGLSITKRLVERMGGQIHLESTMSKGSIFWFAVTLPIAVEFKKDEVRKQGAIVAYEGKRHILLIIDDKEKNRTILNNLLNPLGFTLLEASNGQEGLTQALQIRPDLILTDLVMPLMDGFEFTRHLRSFSNLCDIPVIATSSGVFEHHQEESRIAGCNRFITKPIQQEELLSALQQLLNLTWIYASDATKGSMQYESDNEILIPYLPTSQLDILYDLAMMGDINGINKQLERIDKNDPQVSIFIEKIKGLTNNFQVEEICHLLAPYLNQKS
ncbi:ATP-binding protein [Beggiatoa leptomitoformis]|nr:ATP-binding protein [Beggiatoa leptomitoformis]